MCSSEVNDKTWITHSSRLRILIDSFCATTTSEARILHTGDGQRSLRRDFVRRAKPPEVIGPRVAPQFEDLNTTGLREIGMPPPLIFAVHPSNLSESSSKTTAFGEEFQPAVTLSLHQQIFREAHVLWRRLIKLR